MKKIIIILIIFITLPEIIKSQENFTDVKPFYFFGVRIITTSNGVCQYYTLYAPDGKIIDVQPMTKKDFLKQAQGLEKSDANPKSEDFFTKFNVIDSAKLMNNVISDIYPVPEDEQLYTYKKNTRYRNSIEAIAEETINNLWKLRFAVYPFASGSLDTVGWTNNFENDYMPKPEQLEILKTYGLEQINGFIWGENLFRLLKDIRNPSWIEDYKNAGIE